MLDKGLSHLVPPSETAKPLPAHLLHHKSCSTEHPTNEVPKPDDPFHDPDSAHVWAEFNVAKPRNPLPLKVDLAKQKTLWHYLGKTSTEAKAQYTSDLKVQLHDPSANFLDSVKPAVPPPQPAPRQSYPASYPTAPRPTSFSGLQGLNKQQPNFYSDLLKSIQQEKANTANPNTHRGLVATGVISSKPLSIQTGTSNKSHPPPKPQQSKVTISTTAKTSQAPQAPMASMGSGMVPMSKVVEAAKNPQQGLEEIRQVNSKQLGLLIQY